MEQKILDLSFLYNLSGNDTNYIHDVINLFLDVVPAGVTNLEQLIKDEADFDAIHKQAHFLKSSAAIIKIREVYDDLVRIVTLSREQKGREEIAERMKNLSANFNEAMPLILAEKERCKPTFS